MSSGAKPGRRAKFRVSVGADGTGPEWAVYKAADGSDTRNLHYAPGVPFANTVPDYGDSTGDPPNPLASLRRLHDWAETIFGPRTPPTG